jgi:predicted phosphodiesterase
VGRRDPVAEARAFLARDLERQAKPYALLQLEISRMKAVKPPKPTGKPRRLTVCGSDIHGHKRDPQAWDVFLQAIRDLEPDGVYLMGDISDGQSMKRHPPAATDVPMTYLQEVLECAKILDDVDRVATKAWDRILLDGNHDADRTDKWVAATCPPQLRDLVPSLWDATRARERGYRVYKGHEQPVRVGDLLLLHGHFYSKHHAAAHLGALGEKCLYGHTHTPQQFTHNLNGKRIQATGMPCLRTLDREWEHQSKVHTWTNGFAIIEWIDGRAYPRNVYIVNGEAVYGRHVWRAK